MRWSYIAGFAIITIGLLTLFGCGKEQPTTGVVAEDAPNDAGRVINLQWEAHPGEAANEVVGYSIMRTAPDGTEEELAETGPGELAFADESIETGTTYNYVVIANLKDGSTAVIGESSAKGVGQWFHVRKTNALIGIVVFCSLVYVFIFTAKRGQDLFVRKIAGLEAVEEAIGRATEMGKPILFVSGLGPADEIATIAAMTILARVAKKTAEYETPLIVPCYDPIVMMVEREMVQAAYTEAGRPDAYDENMVFFVTQSQFGYVAAVDGIMLRERPATNFYMGAFYAESLILAETGAETGAIQIAGTDRVTQLPFFITACDYTLMGEELYAASAYLSRDALLLGSLKGQDWGKAIIMVLMIIGIILMSLNGIGGLNMMWVAQLFEGATG
jgi:hypothetical protein